MTFVDVMDFGACWESIALATFVSVFLLSLVGVIAARTLRLVPALRESILFAALLACIFVPLIGSASRITGRPLWILTLSRPAEISVTSSPTTTREIVLQRELTGRAVDAWIDQMLREPMDTSSEVENTVVTSTSRTAQPAMVPPITPNATASLASLKLSWMLLAAWGFGTVCLGVLTIRGICLARQIRRDAAHIDDSRLRAISEQVAETVILRRIPQLMQSERVSAPVVMGYREPVIILPTWVYRDASDPDLRDILIHEFAHVSRGDTGTIYLQALVRCLFWPVVTIHWLNRELSLAREEVCDNFVLAHDDAVSYGELLLRLAKRAIEPDWLSGTIGLLNWRGELERRFVSIFDLRTRRTTTISRLTRVALALGFLLTGAVLCGTRLAIAQPKPDVTKQVNPTPIAVTRSLRPRSTTDAIGDSLPQGALMRLGTMRFRPPSIVDDLVLSPDEKTIVSIGNELIAWNVETGEELWRENSRSFGFDFRGPRYGSHPIAFSSDSTHFYTPGRVDEVNVWETRTGQRRSLTLKPPANGLKAFLGAFRPKTPTLAVDITQDGQSLAIGLESRLTVCDQAGHVRFEIENTATANPFDNNDRLTFFGNYCMGKFSPDGKMLAFVASDHPDKLQLFDSSNGDELRTIELAAKLVRFAFSPDGTQVVVTERDNAVRLYSVASGNRIWSKRIELDAVFENYTSAVAFSPDGKTIAAGATDRRIYLLNPRTGEETAKLVGHHGYPWAIVFSTDSRVLYSSGWDNLIRRWNVEEHRQLPLPRGLHASDVVAISPTSRLLAYQDDARIIHLLDAETETDLRTFALPDTTFTRLSFSPDGRQLAAGGSSQENFEVKIWDVQSGESVRHWSFPVGRRRYSSVEALHFTPDGTRLAAVIFGKSAAHVWDLTTGAELAKLSHKDIYGASFSPDGKTLATAGWDATVRFWNTETWAASGELEIPKRDKNEDAGNDDPRMYTVCYAPDGLLFATTHLDGTVRVFQTSDRSLRAEFKIDFRFSYGSTKFSPDGLWLATGAASGKVQLWDPATGENVKDVGQHQSDVYSVEFGHDSRTLVSGSDDNVSYLWDLRPVELLAFDDAESVWNALSSNDSKAAYQASWTLSEGADRWVPLLAEKLRAVKSVIDIEHIDEYRTKEENQQRQEMKRRLVEKDPQIESSLTVRRAIAILAQIQTPSAIDLLRELAAQRQNGPMSDYATKALAQLKSGEAK